MSEESKWLTSMLGCFFLSGFCSALPKQSSNCCLMPYTPVTVHCRRLGWRSATLHNSLFDQRLVIKDSGKSLVFDSPTSYCSIRNPSQGRQQLWRPFPTMIHNVSVQLTIPLETSFLAGKLKDLHTCCIWHYSGITCSLLYN